MSKNKDSPIYSKLGIISSLPLGGQEGDTTSRSSGVVNRKLWRAMDLDMAHPSGKTLILSFSYSFP